MGGGGRDAQRRPRLPLATAGPDAARDPDRFARTLAIMRISAAGCVPGILSMLLLRKQELAKSGQGEHVEELGALYDVLKARLNLLYLFRGPEERWVKTTPAGQRRTASVRVEAP